MTVKKNQFKVGDLCTQVDDIEGGGESPAVGAHILAVVDVDGLRIHCAGSVTEHKGHPSACDWYRAPELRKIGTL